MVKKASFLSEKTVLVIFALIVIAAFAMRFYQLDSRPLHYDEGRHWAYFVEKIYTSQPLVYRSNFHGFTSWYLGVLPLYFFGESVFSLRFMVALFGALTVVLLFPLKKRLGSIGLIVSSAFLAVSPSMVYYSRNFTQHTFFVFFVLLSFVLLLKYLECLRKRFLYLLALSSAMLLTTHEFALIFFGIAVFFVLLLYFTVVDFRKKTQAAFSKTSREAVVLSLLIFLIVVFAVMSNFFTNFTNLYNFLFSNFGTQLRKAFTSSLSQPFFYYLAIFLPIELPVFIGSIAALFFLRRNYFFLFILFTAFASFFIFSLGPHKVPWIFIAVLLPAFLLFGLAADSAFCKIRNSKQFESLFCILLASLFVFSLLTSLNLNYAIPSSSKNKLDFTGTSTDVYRLAGDINVFSAGKPAKILIGFETYWPLPFYLRNNKLYFGKNITSFNPSNYQNFDILIMPSEVLDKNSHSLLFEEKVFKLRHSFEVTVFFKKPAFSKS